MGPPAVVLLSGGLDSAVALAVTKELGLSPYAMSFRYGQRHAGEVDAARRIAASQHVLAHRIVDIDLRAFGGSALTADLTVPEHRAEAAVAEIPITYVPARNTIFLSFALAWAEVLGSTDIVIGVNAVDYSGYPDCRPEYIAAFQAMANLATKAAVADEKRVTIRTPLIRLSKADIIRRGLALGVDYGLTRSCYQLDDQGRSCGRCDACAIRLRGFADLGIPDPAPYLLPV
jgi:7-cyano-7-deazaguanine synthase